MSEGRAIVSLQHVEKSFGDTMVLKDISLSVREGEIVSIIGSSGGGKSTLLRCATLLETFEKGSLFYDDLCVADGQSGASVYGSKATLKAARMKFGLVFQNFNLFPHKSVLHNVMDAPVRVLKLPKAQAREEALHFIDMMGLAGKEDMVPCELSGGQQQRVAIARALAMKPEMLYFDEPTSALDPELTQEVLKVIRELAEQHMTMAIVTHEMGFARDVSERVVFMDKGLIVEEGPAKQVIDNPQHERTRAFMSKREQ